MSEQMSANFTVTVQEFSEAAREEGVSDETILKIIKKLRKLNDKKSETLLSTFNLSPRTYNSLRMKGIRTEEDLKEFIQLRGINSLNTLRNFTKARHEELRKTFPWIVDFE